MLLDLNNLPNDVALLHRLVRDLSSHLNEQQSTLTQTRDALRSSQSELKSNAERIEWLEYQLEQLRRARFGKSSEKLSPDQLALWQSELDEQIAETEQALAQEQDQPAAQPEPQSQNKPKRKPLPAHLPREDHLHTLPCCSACSGELKEIGEEAVEQLDYRPASFFVRRHTKKKYACGQCETAVTAALPAQPIEKGLPGPGLLAHVAVSKFCDHQPLYRQSEIYGRSQIDLPRSTLSGWMGQCHWLLRPLVKRMRELLLKESILHTDDTIVPVLDPGRRKTKQGRLWVYLKPKRFGKPIVVYDYTPTRQKSGPRDWLSNFKGYLHADGYPGYDDLYRDGAIIEVGCWAHARRKFFEVEQATGSPLAREALLRIKELFDVEDQLKQAEADFETIALTRQRETIPRLTALKAWFDETLLGLSNKSALAGAIAYAVKNWAALTRYTTDGRLAMHNNDAENALRGVVLGRKNFLFAGNDSGGERAATFYSLIETCKLNGIDPFAYLQDVLARLPSHPANALDELLPHNWAGQTA